MSNLFPPTASQDAYTGPVTPSEITNPTKILQPRSTSQEIKPYNLTRKLHSAHVHNTAIGTYHAGPFTVTGGTLLPTGEYVVVHSNEYPASLQTYSAVNIDTQETIELFTRIEYDAIYTWNVKINIFENKMWIEAQSTDGVWHLDAYEGLNFTSKTVAITKDDIANIVTPDWETTDGYIIGVSTNGGREFTIAACNFGIPLLVLTTIYGEYWTDATQGHIVLVNSDGVRLVENYTYPGYRNDQHTLFSNSNNNSNGIWMETYINSSGYSKYTKYVFTESSFSKRTSEPVYEASGFTYVRNDNLLYIDNIYYEVVFLFSDTGTSITHSQQSYTSFGMPTEPYWANLSVNYTKDNRWTYIKYPAMEYNYIDDDVSIIPTSLGTLSSTGVITFSTHLLGATSTGRQLYAYSGTATGLGAGTWDIFFSA